LAFGGRVEWGYRAVPELANGIIGIQLSADFYSWHQLGFNFDHIPVGLAANYHFRLDNSRWDPFGGAGLGYSIVSCNAPAVAGVESCANSTLYLIARVGARYHLADTFAFYADVGAGAATLNLGVSFRAR
jgi:outer membrane protein W